MARRVIAIAVALFLHAVASAVQASPTLKFVESASVHHRKSGLTEPSGLSIRSEGGYWIDSDDTPAVFAVDEQGHITDRIDLNPDVADLEGIVEVPEKNALLALSEDRAEIFRLDVTGKGISTTHPLRELLGATSSRNGTFGPEGIAVDDDGRVWVIVEDPPQLILLSPRLDQIVRRINLNTLDGFAGRHPSRQIDASGLAYDRYRKALWIVSDRGKAVFYMKASSEKVARYDLAFTTENGKIRRVKNPEGIAVSHDGSLLMKGRSSHKVQREFPHLRKRYWGRRFWGRGYFSTTNGAITEDFVLQYLEQHIADPTGASR